MLALSEQLVSREESCKGLA